jgi:transcription elongation factor Elf1
MTVNDCFICPLCGNTTVVIEDARPLMSDIRIDTLGCNRCGSQWRIYSKVAEMQTEIIRYPEEQASPVQETETVE